MIDRVIFEYVLLRTGLRIYGVPGEKPLEWLEQSNLFLCCDATAPTLVRQSQFAEIHVLMYRWRIDFFSRGTTRLATDAK